ncbi:MAG: heavy metal-associated domain-containing protein [Polaromonas sp.]
MRTIEFDVSGMSCGACVSHVMQALQPLPGVSHVDVDLAHGQVTVSGELPEGGEMLISALTDAGYPARLATSVAPASPPKKAGGRCCG